MDAQNAVESDPTRPVGASSPQPPPGPEPDRKPKLPTNLRTASPVRDARLKVNAAAAVAADDASSTARPDDSPLDRDSDAETIVLPGKDGHSPSKARKVRQEDRSESDSEAAKAKAGRGKPDDNDAGGNGDKFLFGTPGNHPGDSTRKKRLSASGPSSLDKDRRPRSIKEAGSSGFSSAPASPTHQQHHNQHQQPPPPPPPPSLQHHPQNHRSRRRSDAAPSTPSDSEQHFHPRISSKISLGDKLTSGERLLPHKRKAPKAESDDETDIRKVRRQRTTSASLDGGRPSKEVRSTPAKSQHDSRARSISPPPRQHRRSISTQLPSQSSNGLNPKRKRLPPPLQPTDYHSDDSSAGGSPHPRSSKLRSYAIPVMADNVSPAKMGPHKKHLDAHGQTLLARACARGEYETAKQRLGERPEDLNVADYAGNTPLQIAAINGCEDIVALLIEAGCNLDCVNYDKDTPLLDAVDNGHLGVVKLLLDAGVNPRKANVNGEEPLDRVSDDTDNAEEIRAALMAARKHAGERRRTSEDGYSHHDPHDVRDSHAPDSPRRSPAATASTSLGRRSGTVRSTKTRNDLLYMPLDDKTLRQAAGRGDEETVARILQVKEGYDDPESMVAAARGGHDLVIQLLLGLGGANADPGPVPSLPSEFATPILAAIGQENIKVLYLLLGQHGFDPTRRFKGETYYEIARRRQGTNWKEEEHLLKNAYDEYKRSHKDTVKNKSPGGRRERERDRDDKLLRRDEAKESSRLHKRNHSSPSREGEVKKKGTATKIASPREKRRSNSFTHRGDDGDTQKRAPVRAKKDSSNISDREASPALSHKPHKTKRTESDLTGMSSDGEAAKPRRKLVSKGELSRERDKQRRALKDPSSPRESRNDDVPEKSKLSEKYHDRTKALKRDESRDHPSGDGATKRHRTSVTPDRPSDVDKGNIEGPVKRRRLDGETQLEKRQKRPPSVDGRPRKSVSSRDGSTKSSAAGGRKERDDGSRDRQEQRDSQHHNSAPLGGGDKSIHVKSEDVDVSMLDIEQPDDAERPEPSKARQDEEEQVKKKQLAEEEAKKEEERKRLEAEEKKKKKKREEEEARKREEEEKARKAEEERKKREAEEERKKREAEEERKKREAEEARKRQEQADRERREAEEAARRQEEEKKRLEEEEQRRREEEERLHRERLEREAAEEARKQREEEERKERERRERAHREEVERKRAAREAEQRRIREEQERVRLDKLPPLLRWLDTCPNPKTPVIAEKFKRMIGARYDTIRQEANGTPEGREQWVLNTHVALLLGEKDLDLSRYTAWERAPVSSLAKLTIWRTEWVFYALIADKLWDLGRQLPGYYGDEDPSFMSFETRQRLKSEAWERFLSMDMFFVKVSDLLYTVPNIPHLRNIKLAVEYRELLESEAQTIGWKATQKWKQDPGADRFFGFAPRHKYYINGVMVGEDIPKPYQTSKTPFPEARVPRRGLVRVYPDEADYERICMEQGLEHLVRGRQATPLPNGVHSSPTSQTVATPTKPLVNGANGHSAHGSEQDVTATHGEALNGINGS